MANAGWNGRVVVDTAGTPEVLFQPVTPGCPQQVTSILLIANEGNGGNIIIAASDKVDATEATRVGSHLLQPGYSMLMRAELGRMINLMGYWVDATNSGDQLRWEVDEGVTIEADSVVVT